MIKFLNLTIENLQPKQDNDCFENLSLPHSNLPRVNFLKNIKICYMDDIYRIFSDNKFIDLKEGDQLLMDGCKITVNLENSFFNFENDETFDGQELAYREIFNIISNSSKKSQENNSFSKEKTSPFEGQLFEFLYEGVPLSEIPIDYK